MARDGDRVNEMLILGTLMERALLDRGLLACFLFRAWMAATEPPVLLLLWLTSTLRSPRMFALALRANVLRGSAALWVLERTAPPPLVAKLEPGSLLAELGAKYSAALEARGDLARWLCLAWLTMGRPITALLGGLAVRWHNGLLARMCTDVVVLQVEVAVWALEMTRGAT